VDDWLGTDRDAGRLGFPTRQLFDPIAVGAELAAGRGTTLRPAP
jgi:hypothetical protein